MKWKSLSGVQLFATPWDFPDQNTGVGSHSLLQGIFPTRGSNPGLPHCRRVLYHCCHLGSSQRWTCRTRVQISDVLITQSCLTLCDPMDYSQPVSSVHGISQVRIPEWVAIPFFRASSQPRDRTQVLWIAGRFYTSWATEVYIIGVPEVSKTQNEIIVKQIIVN